MLTSGTLKISNSPTVALMWSTGFLNIGEKLVGGVIGAFGWGSHNPIPCCSTFFNTSSGPNKTPSCGEGSPLLFIVSFCKLKHYNFKHHNNCNLH